MFIVSIMLVQTITEGGFLFPKKRSVFIRNYVYSNCTGLDVKIHCESGNNDLGEHVIPFGGEYSFRFRPWIKTLFHCKLKWKNGTKAFDVFDYRRDWKWCKRSCRWAIKVKGPNLWDEKEHHYIEYKW